MTSRRQRLESVFHRARALEGEARQALLGSEVADDPELFRELESLLSACRGATERVEVALGSAVADVRADSRADLVPLTVPDRIGPYRVEREVGRGGLATVYLAHRVEPELLQRVAIKIAFLAADETIAARAAQERWILARLEHPNIARFLDAGSLDDGRFYLVMEYVEGQPIDAYSRQHRLSVADRLTLMVTVCEAVQLAHQNLVLHRDLKPDNVFVDHHGLVKLLDFGIAKLLGNAQGAHDSPVTQRGERWLTPGYASPEQRAGDELTTASDVYSLGMLLHRLLTGKLVATDADAQGPEASPSALLRDPGVRQAVGVGSLGGLVGRDLDVVLAKALHPDVKQRYASPQAFADDLQRLRDMRPIRARPDRVGYRLRRFLARHRGAVVLTVMVAAMLAVSLAIAFQQARSARKAVDESMRFSDFLVQTLGLADPRSLPGNDISVDDLLISVVERLLSDPAEDEAPGAAARLELVGAVLLSRGQAERALEVLNRGARLVTQDGDDQRLHATILNRIGEAHEALGNLGEAEAHLRWAMAMRATRLGGDDLAFSESANDLAMVLAQRGSYGEAKALLDRVLATRQRILGPEHPQVATVHSNLGFLFQSQGDAASAATAFRRALAISRQALGSEHPSVAKNLNNLGVTLYMLGDAENAVQTLARALDIRRRSLPAGHPDIEESEHNLSAAEKLVRPAP